MGSDESKSKPIKQTFLLSYFDEDADDEDEHSPKSFVSPKPLFDFDASQIPYQPSIDATAPPVLFVHRKHYGLQLLFRVIEDTHRKAPVPGLAHVYRHLRAAEPLMPRYRLDGAVKGLPVSASVLNELAKPKQTKSLASAAPHPPSAPLSSSSKSFRPIAKKVEETETSAACEVSEADVQSEHSIAAEADRDIMQRLAAEKKVRAWAKQSPIVLLRRYFVKYVRWLPYRRQTRPLRIAALEMRAVTELAFLRDSYRKWLEILRWRIHVGIAKRFTEKQGKGSRLRGGKLSRANLRDLVQDVVLEEDLRPRAKPKMPEKPHESVVAPIESSDSEPDSVPEPRLEEPTIITAKNVKAADAVSAFSVPVEECCGLLDLVDRCLGPAVHHTTTECYELAGDIQVDIDAAPRLKAKQVELKSGLATYLRQVETHISSMPTFEAVEASSPTAYNEVRIQMEAYLVALLRYLFDEGDEQDVNADIVQLALPMLAPMIDLSSLVAQGNLLHLAARSCSCRYLRQLLRQTIFVDDALALELLDDCFPAAEEGRNLFRFMAFVRQLLQNNDGMQLRDANLKSRVTSTLARVLSVVVSLPISLVESEAVTMSERCRFMCEIASDSRFNASFDIVLRDGHSLFSLAVSQGDANLAPIRCMMTQCGKVASEFVAQTLPQKGSPLLQAIFAKAEITTELLLTYPKVTDSLNKPLPRPFDKLLLDVVCRCTDDSTERLVRLLRRHGARSDLDASFSSGSPSPQPSPGAMSLNGSLSHLMDLDLKSSQGDVNSPRSPLSPRNPQDPEGSLLGVRKDTMQPHPPVSTKPMYSRDPVEPAMDDLKSPTMEPTIDDILRDDEWTLSPVFTAIKPDPAVSSAPKTFKPNIDDLFGDGSGSWGAELEEEDRDRTPPTKANIDDLFTPSEGHLSASEESLQFDLDDD